MGNACSSGAERKKGDSSSSCSDFETWLDAPNLKLGLDGDVNDAFTFTKDVLGEGSTSTVWLGMDKKTKDYVAIKQSSKELLKQQQGRASRVKEVEILAKLQTEDRPREIPVLLGTFEDEEFLYLVTSVCYGGDLFSHIAARPSFCEQAASTLARKILEATAKLHLRGIVHLNLRPENVLLPSPGDENSIQLIHFGQAARISPGGVLTEKVSTNFYSAPEVVKGSYTQAADLWSFGALVFVMVGGVPPVHTLKDVLGNPTWIKLQNGQVERLPENTSPLLEDFLIKLLTPDKGSRLSPLEALNHPWIACPELLRKVPLSSAISNAAEYSLVRKKTSNVTTKKYYVQDEKRQQNKVIFSPRRPEGSGEMKWKNVGTTVVGDLREFKRCDSQSKVFVEVLDPPTPRRKSRKNTHEYIHFEASPSPRTKEKNAMARGA